MSVLSLGAAGPGLAAGGGGVLATQGLELRRLPGGCTLASRPLRHVPDLLEERRQLPVLQLQRDAHVGVLHTKGPQLGQDPEEPAVDDGAARRGAVLVHDVRFHGVQVISLDLFD